MYRFLLSQIRLSSVTFVHPTQELKLAAIFLLCCVPWPSFDLRAKFFGDRPGEPLRRPSEALNARGVAKLSDVAFGYFISWWVILVYLLVHWSVRFQIEVFQVVRIPVAARGCLPSGQTSVLPPPPIRSVLQSRYFSGSRTWRCEPNFGSPLLSPSRSITSPLPFSHSHFPPISLSSLRSGPLKSR